MRTWRKQYAAPRRGAGGRRAVRVVPRAARPTPRSASASAPTTASTPTPWTPIIFARTLLPLIQLPPAGHWDDTRRAGVRARPAPAARPRRRRDARARALPRRLRARRAGATSPPGRASPSATSRPPGSGWRPSTYGTSGRRSTTCPARRCRRPTRRCRRASSPTGTSRCSPTPTASGSWRRRSQALQLTLSGDPTVTVDGRVAASWGIRDDVLEITPHVELSRAQREAIREEALRTAARAVRGSGRERAPRTTQAALRAACTDLYRHPA